MKKMKIMNNIKTLYKTSALAVIAVLFGLGTISCEVGLGAAVDMEAPKVAVTSHQDNESVPESFTLQGTVSDNEEVTLLTIDLDDADIHFKINPGKDWQKKTSRAEGWQTITSDDNNYCREIDGVWNWSIAINTDERALTKQGHTYIISASATDARENTGKNSKQELSLIVDTESPSVSIYKPEIFDSYASLKQDVDADKYQLKDGNILSSLLNGTIQLFGRQDQALSFKALRIEFDNGQVEGAKSTANTQTAVTSIDEILALQDAKIADATAPTVYFAKTLTGSDLREWSLTVNPEEWATNTSGVANGLNTGLHIIRIISTSLSSSNAWQRKVLGYFLWYPEADKPWITMAAGDLVEKTTNAYECYPGSNISGNIQDDDGIQSFVTTLYKRNKANDTDTAYTYPDGTSGTKTHALPQTNAGEKPKYSAWTVVAPAENGSYKIVLELTDVYGNKDTLEKYFDISDVKAPEINITAPLNDTSAIIADESGNITFTGTISDDGSLESVAMVWLNPVLRNNPDNKIKYLTGNDYSITQNDDDPDWSIGTEAGADDGHGNKIFKFTLTAGQKELTLNKTINLFAQTGLNIGGTYDTYENGKTVKHELLLCSQDFIFRAYDGHKATVKIITLTGDTQAPEIDFTTISINGETKNISDSPTYTNSSNGQPAIISGTWSDKFNADISNESRLFDLMVTWGTDAEKQSVKAIRTGGTWTATIPKAPTGGGTITAELRDFGGNKKTIQSAVRIATTGFGLARIGCIEDDGSYTKDKVLHFTVEFKKNTNIDTTGGTPTLTLSNGKTAKYDPNYGTGYGNGYPIHVYTYTVGKNEDTVDDETTEDVDERKLSVTKINANDAKWYDSETGNEITTSVAVSNLPPKGNLSDSRSIVIDTAAPSILSLNPVSEKGAFKKGSKILLKLEFSEDVKIEGASNLKVQFDHKKNGTGANITTTMTTVSGSKYALFEYEVDDNENASTLTFDKLLHDSVTVEDLAGNALSGWTPGNRNTDASKAFTGFEVDTAVPDAPDLKNASGDGDWNPDSVIFSDSGTSFKIEGESGAEIEYTTDGESWIPYTTNKTIIISNNGTYHVKARQTDKAGNESESGEKTFTIEKGELLKKITAKTSSTTYTTTNKIEGRIEFRKPVTIEAGAKVTLNVNNNTKKVAIKECTSADGESNEFTFDYIIAEGDKITDNAKLDVVGWSFSTVTFKDANNENVTVSMPVPAAGNNKRFNENREIYILTGKPTIADGKITLVEEEGNPVLKIEFDRPVTKLNGNITLTQDISTGKYHVPAVLSVDEYNELAGNTTTLENSTKTVKEVIAGTSQVSGAYKKGVNGASYKIKDNKTIWTNDVTAKYVLDFDKADTATELVSAFIAAKKHIVTIPVVADEVSITGAIMTIKLTGNYELPVKGTSYTVKVSEAIVTDAVQHTNDEKDNVIVSYTGVENPVIRLNKEESKYTITGAGNTASASANMVPAQTIGMRIDCQTPGVEIKYAMTPKKTTAVTVNERRATPFVTQTDDPAAPASADKTYNANQPIITLAEGDDYLVNNYANATGVKIAIIATAKNKDTGEIETSYEYATRTVLKFNLSSSWDGAIASYSSTGLSNTNLKVWVMGGDSPYGGNSKDPFPLSWSDPGSWFLMSGTFPDANLISQWYVVSWDITSETYHGFAIGTVPGDAATMGPDEWYPAENSWTSQKSNYVLYPGETLIMDTANTTPTFWFRQGNRTGR